MAQLISDQIEFKAWSNIGDKESKYMMIDLSSCCHIALKVSIVMRHSGGKWGGEGHSATISTQWKHRCCYTYGILKRF